MLKQNRVNIIHLCDYLILKKQHEIWLMVPPLMLQYSLIQKAARELRALQTS